MEIREDDSILILSAEARNGLCKRMARAYRNYHAKGGTRIEPTFSDFKSIDARDVWGYGVGKLSIIEFNNLCKNHSIYLGWDATILSWKNNKHNHRKKIIERYIATCQQKIDHEKEKIEAYRIEISHLDRRIE